MASSLSNNQFPLSPGQTDQQFHGGFCVLAPHDFTAISDNDDLRRRPFVAYDQGHETRQVSMLADLLEPFAKTQSTAAAQTLIDQFGSIDRALTAPPKHLQLALRDYGLLARCILAAHKLVESSNKFRLRSRPIHAFDPNLVYHLRKKFKNLRIEQTRCVFLDHSMSFIREERQTSGSVSDVTLNAGALVERAFQLGATNIMLAHNHPSGCSRPSTIDERATKKLADLLSCLGLKLVDHLIFSESGLFSFAKAGRL